MKLMREVELERLFLGDKVEKVLVTRNSSGEKWKIELRIESIRGVQVASPMTKRGVERQFKTLDTAAKYIKQVGGMEFCVVP